MITIGVVTVSISGFVGYSSLRDYTFHQRPFDSGAWKQGNARVRGEMLESLRDQSLLGGKTRSEVLDTLGKPDMDREGQIRYIVDNGRRIMWKPFLSSLIVEFDGNSRVYRVDTVD